MGELQIAKRQYPDIFNYGLRGVGNKIYLDEPAIARIYTEVYQLKQWEGALYDQCGPISVDDLEREMNLLLIDKYDVYSSVNSKAKKIAALIPSLAPEEEVKINPSQIHLNNGTIEIELSEINGEMQVVFSFTDAREYSPYRRLPVEYDPGAKRPEHFLHWLNDLLDEEDVSAFQEALGYLLIPSTKAQMSFYLIGEGGAGKSIMQHVLKVLFGRAWTPLQFSRLNGSDNGGRFLIPLLQGRLVAYDDDLPASQMGETEIFKKLITCESPMISERKGKDMELFQPFVRVFASGNFSLSSVCDSSSAFWRRVLIFGVRPKDPHRKDDPFLGDKIMAEGEGILLWALDGLKRLLENKYKFSESEKSKRLKREAMRENNSVISFVETELIFDEKARTPRADMYKAYSSYCRDNAFDTVRKKDAFAYILSELIKHGGDQSRQNRIETYRGVRIARPITPTITLRGGNKA